MRETPRKTASRSTRRSPTRWRHLSDQYPDDLELAVIAAEAGMDTQPWDYWEPGGHEPRGRGADIQKRLEAVLANSPTTAWAMHLYIHFVEASDRPERGEPLRDRLAALMPGQGISCTCRATSISASVATRICWSPMRPPKVDEGYIAETGAAGVYPIAYYSHNLHFVLVSAALLGDTQTVLSQAEKLDKWLSNDIGDANPLHAAAEGGAIFAWALWRSRHDSRPCRPARRATLCEGDVALRPRHGPGCKERSCRRSGSRGDSTRLRKTPTGRPSRCGASRPNWC